MTLYELFPGYIVNISTYTHLPSRLWLIDVRILRVDGEPIRGFLLDAVKKQESMRLF